MATLEEILADVGLSESPSQTKTAAAPSTSEVNEVLEGLGLDGIEEAAGQIKTASEERNHMGLTDIYEDLFGEETVTEDGQTKVASEEVVEEEGEEASGSNALGELTGIYFNVMQEEFMDKIAGDLEAEAGAGHKPQSGVKDGGQLSSIVGKEGDPAVAVNHPASSGAPLKVMTGNKSPYGPNARAAIKQILSRKMKSEAGEVGGSHE